MKSQSCLCMQTSKAQPDFYDCVSVLAFVSETTIGGLSAARTWQTTMSAGRCAWIKLCISSLLHCPFFCLYYLSTSIFPPRPRLHLRGVFRPPLLRALCQCSFVRSGWDSALCVSLCTHHAQLFTDWFCKRSRGAETEGGGTGGQWIDHGSLVHKTKPKCKQGEEIFKRQPLNCATNRMSTVATLFGLGEKWSGERQDRTKAAGLCLHCIWAHLSVGIASPPAGL